MGSEKEHHTVAFGKYSWKPQSTIPTHERGLGREPSIGMKLYGIMGWRLIGMWWNLTTVQKMAWDEFLLPVCLRMSIKLEKQGHFWKLATLFLYVEAYQSHHRTIWSDFMIWCSLQERWALCCQPLQWSDTHTSHFWAGRSWENSLQRVSVLSLLNRTTRPNLSWKACAIATRSFLQE